MAFYQKLDKAIKSSNSLLCVGLDVGRSFSFDKSIIDATHDFVCAYKPNTAFYEAHGAHGVTVLKQTCDYIKKKHPRILLIVDAKRGDIGHSNYGYAKFFFDYLKADAVTLNPYAGGEALKPFLDRKEKGSFILCRTSNPGADEFQDELYKKVATHVSVKWNYNYNCGLVVGATYPRELKIVRRIVKGIPLLIPGVGAQGADLVNTVKFGIDASSTNAIISVSRSVIFAKDPGIAAQRIRDEINRYRNEN